MLEMIRIDSSLSLFLSFLSNIRNESFRTNLACVSPHFENFVARRVCVSIFPSVPAKCNFRLFIAFRASRRGGMEIPKPARCPRHVYRAVTANWSRRDHVSSRVANYFSLFAMKKCYTARRTVIYLFFSREYNRRNLYK